MADPGSFGEGVLGYESRCIFATNIIYEPEKWHAFTDYITKEKQLRLFPMMDNKNILKCCCQTVRERNLLNCPPPPRWIRHRHSQYSDKRIHLCIPEHSEHNNNQFRQLSERIVTGPGYDVKLIRCCPQYDVKLMWRQWRHRGNDIVSVAAICVVAICAAVQLIFLFGRTRLAV